MLNSIVSVLDRCLFIYSANVKDLYHVFSFVLF